LIKTSVISLILS